MWLWSTIHGSRSFGIWCNGRLGQRCDLMPGPRYLSYLWRSWVHIIKLTFPSRRFSFHLACIWAFAITSSKTVYLGSLIMAPVMQDISHHSLTVTSLRDQPWITLVCVYCAALKGRSASEEKLSQTAPPELPRTGRTTLTYLLWKSFCQIGHFCNL